MIVVFILNYNQEIAFSSPFIDLYKFTFKNHPLEVADFSNIKDDLTML
jgi:hypothetical protein